MASGPSARGVTSTEGSRQTVTFGREVASRDAATSTGESSPARPEVFYRYEDSSGRVTIVDSLSKLPADVRNQAVRVELSGGHSAQAGPSSGREAGARSGSSALLEKFGIASLDSASFGLGLGSGLVVASVFFLLFGRGSGALARWLVRGAIALGIGLLILGAYLGAIRRSAGLGGSAITGPSQLVEDARRAVEQIREQRAAQERQLEELEESSK